MGAVWYYEDKGAKKGPVTKEYLESLLSGNLIAVETLVWTQGYEGWTPATGVIELTITPVAQPGSISGVKVPRVPPTKMVPTQRISAFVKMPPANGSGRSAAQKGSRRVRTGAKTPARKGGLLLVAAAVLLCACGTGAYFIFGTGMATAKVQRPAEPAKTNIAAPENKSSTVAK